MKISISEIFNALEKNNQNTGGAYIEKNDKALFIRSEGFVASIEDIENILVKQTEDGIPVLIRDVAKSANWFSNTIWCHHQKWRR